MQWEKIIEIRSSAKNVFLIDGLLDRMGNTLKDTKHIVSTSSNFLHARFQRNDLSFTNGYHQPPHNPRAEPALLPRPISVEIELFGYQTNGMIRVNNLINQSWKTSKNFGGQVVAEF